MTTHSPARPPAPEPRSRWGLPGREPKQPAGAVLPESEPPANPATPERILQRIDWQVIRRLDGLLQGDYRSLFYGYGVDFSDLREYQPEDDIRYIDWNVTARMDTPYVRQYVEDREITAWFLLDLSPSVDFGTALGEKRAVLVDFVATLARLLTRHGNRVGAIFYGSKVERTIPARGGRMQVLRLINELLRQPRLPKAPFTRLSPLLESGLQSIRRRSLVVVVSDFISEPGWEKPLSLLNQHHEVLAVRLWDPSELQLPDVGPVILEDAETGEQLYVDTSDKSFRARYEAAGQAREAALSESFKHAGVDALPLSTGEDLVHAIVRFAATRQRRRGPAGAKVPAGVIASGSAFTTSGAAGARNPQPNTAPRDRKKSP